MKYTSLQLRIFQCLIIYSIFGIQLNTELNSQTITWSSGGPEDATVIDLAIYPNSSNIVLAVVKDIFGVAITTNFGNTWGYLANPPSSYTFGSVVTYDPNNPSIIYVGVFIHSGRSFGIWKSTDGGESWTYKSIFTFNWNNVTNGVSDIWVDPNDSNTILVAIQGGTDFMGSHGGGVYRSTNGGTKWYRAPVMLRIQSVYTIASDPTDSRILYYGNFNGYVYRSTRVDLGWSTIAGGSEGFGSVRDIVVDSNSHVYVATSKGLMKWDGSDWTMLAGLPTDDIRALATNSGILYIGTSENGVLVSEDGGNTWIELNDGLGNLSINVLAISDSEPKVIYAGTDSGVWSRSAVLSIKSFDVVKGIPSQFELEQNYPNPFNPSTTIKYGLEKDSQIKVEIYDISGKLISTLLNNNQTQGWHSVIWNGNDDFGNPVSAGIYLYKIQAGDFVQTKKMLLLK